MRAKARSEIRSVKIRYYAETDTLYIEFRDAPVAETSDLDENTLLDMDAQGNICAITVEHASTRAGIPQFSYEQVPA
jgi:uncharacterized protein YuzE